MLLVVFPVVDERIEYAKANIVPSILVLGSRVSEANDK